MAILNKVTQLVDGIDIVTAKDIMDTQETAISAINKAEEALDKVKDTPSGGNEYDDTELRGLIDKKAELDASNLSDVNVASWKSKLGVGQSSSYDDTQVKADIAANAANILSMQSSINTLNSTTLKASNGLRLVYGDTYVSEKNQDINTGLSTVVGFQAILHEAVGTSTNLGITLYWRSSSGGVVNVTPRSTGNGAYSVGHTWHWWAIGY